MKWKPAQFELCVVKEVSTKRSDGTSGDAMNLTSYTITYH
jgi:hypothetical protein